MKNNLLIFLFAVLMAGIYASLYFFLQPQMVGGQQWIFNTPDETANYFFADHLVETGKITVPEERNKLTSDLSLVHPRSTTVVDNQLAPGSLLGFILLLESFGRVLSPAVVPFVVPLLAIGGLLTLYSLVKRWFGQSMAWWAIFFVAIMPGYWYYHSRSLFSNGAFVDLIIIALWYIQRHIDRQKWVDLLIGALFVGLALTLRTTELIWVLGLVGIFTASQLPWRRWPLVGGLIGLGIGASFVPILQLQQATYGSWLSTGYVPAGIEQVGEGGYWAVTLIKQFFLPFGFDISSIAYFVYQYVVKLHWWPVLLASCGLALLMMKIIKQEVITNQWKIYLALAGFVSTFIFIYYGSWFFFNNLSGLALIGSSQVRYLLPVYIMLAPLMAYFVTILLQAVPTRRMQIVSGGVIVGLTLFFSIHTVVFAGSESLTAVYHTVRDYHQIQQLTVTMTEDDAVIVTSYNDKVFFPSRGVITYWREPHFIASIQQLATVHPVYFYIIDKENELKYLAEQNVEVKLIFTVNDREAMYRLINK